MEDLLCAISKNTIKDKKMVFFSFKSSTKRKREKRNVERKENEEEWLFKPRHSWEPKCAAQLRCASLHVGVALHVPIIFFYLGLIKQCFYLVLNIWYLFNLFPYFISPESNEGPTSGKGREGKRKRWKAKLD